MKQCPELRKYCEDYPDIGECAKKLLNRNRGLGVHAGGLIISSMPLPDLVPLVKRKDNPQASAWVEGLNGQDLQPVGLVKFDLLVVSNLLQIAKCCELVKNRYKLKGICALEGQPDWTDVEAWRNDPTALSMADVGDLKGIFQFDSDTVRNMCCQGGVDRFEDLVAYTSLNRPGPLNMKMQERYIERKRGREKYSLHPLLQPVLGKTYGVIIYQEQVMRILNVVGEIPLKDCELVRKAISKKKVESFIKYKEIFVLNGQKNLGVREEEINHLWNQIEAFAEYGFNLSHAVAYTYISSYLLYLKSHYPHEFYTSILSCESLSDKIKEYKMEAKLHGVDVQKLDINKSKVNFDLQSKDIFFGLSNVKGIGEGPAERIAQLQPFKNFEDFLERFGTDASVLKPLIGLNCFKERDPITLWKFVEHYKSYSKKIDDKKKRHASSLEKYEQDFRELFPEETMSLSDIKEDEPYNLEYWKKYDAEEEQYVEKNVEIDHEEEGSFSKVVNGSVTLECGITIEKEIIKHYKKVKVKKGWNKLNAFKNLWQKRKRSIEKSQDIVLDKPSLNNFNPAEYEREHKLEEEFSDPVFCENKYYGFAWVHPLENSPDYKGGLTFNNLKNSQDVAVGAVEIRVLECNKTKSKKGTVYYQLIADDVTGQENKIIVWQDDWERFQQEFTENNLLRIRLQPPTNGFSTFTIESNQTKVRWKGVKKYEDKKDDIRVVVLKKAEIQNKIMTNKECLDQFENCKMEKK
jgi:DNA polymerase III alpha subunit